MKNVISVICLSSLLLCGIGCQREGASEKAGKRVDEIVDNVKEGENPLHKKGAAEKVGESLDKAVHGDN